MLSAIADHWPTAAGFVFGAGALYGACRYDSRRTREELHRLDRRAESVERACGDKQSRCRGDLSARFDELNEKIDRKFSKLDLMAEDLAFLRGRLEGK